MQYVQKLPLVFMQTFYLHVEDRTGIYLNPVMLHNIFRQTHLVLVLDIHKLLLRLLVVGVNFQFVDLRQIGNPVATHMSRHPVGKQRIRMKKETSLRNAIGLIVKLLGHHLVEILKLLILQNLRM